ncbi:MAG: 6-bladed beta-propeller [Acidobacteria bacterium]|nr:6-bladed beta-propeller [Acidobacteriota bacterium]
MRETVAAGLALAICGCGSPAEAPDPEAWVGEVAVDGGVTTVRNVSGSVWGGEARLVPEMEIGMAEGPDEYMFGRVRAIHSTGDRILIADRDANLVRAYDWDGEFLYQIGGPGQGPGEYGSLAYIGEDSSGGILIPDFGGRRMLLFSAGGEYEAQWPLSGVGCCIVPMLVAHDDTVYLESTKYRFSERAVAPFAPDGTPAVVIDPPEYDLPEHTVEFRGQSQSVPFSPAVVWRIGFGGEVISAPSHQANIRVVRPNGTELRIERVHDPVPVPPAEAAWYKRMITASYSEIEPGWTWGSGEFPTHKPAFTQFLPSPDGRLWVLRQGPSRRLETCNPEAQTSAEFREGVCWRDTLAFDVHGPEGRFLGAVRLPDEVLTWTALPWISGDTVIANVEDADGVYKVVRYRLELPESSRSP